MFTRVRAGTRKKKSAIRRGCVILSCARRHPERSPVILSVSEGSFLQHRQRMLHWSGARPWCPPQSRHAQSAPQLLTPNSVPRMTALRGLPWPAAPMDPSPEAALCLRIRKSRIRDREYFPRKVAGYPMLGDARRCDYQVSYFSRCAFRLHERSPSS